MGILYIRNENDEFVAIPALKGDKGEDGFSPIITENINNTDEIYQLDIETVDGKFTTPNLKGNGVEAPTGEYKHSIKVIGTIGAGYYSTGISLDQITSVYETGSPVSDLYGGWTIDSVESDDISIADFANFSNYTDTNIISENVTVRNLFELSSSEAAGTTYSIIYQWNGYQKKATTTYTSIEELENIKGITIDRDTEDMCASILANLKPNEELVLNSVDNIGFGINSTVYGNTINKIVFYIGEKGSVIAYLKNGAVATRSYGEDYLQSWDFSLTNIDTYITYHSIEDLEARKDETLFFANEEPDTKIQVIFEALDFGEKFFSGKATSAEEWGIETSGNPALPIFQIIKYHDSSSERGCVYAIDSLGNIYIRNIYRSNLDTDWTVNYKTEINDSAIDEYTTWSSSKIDQSIKKTYYNLTQMNLTEDATIDDIMNALDYGEEAVIQISDFSNKEQFLNEHGCFFCRKCGPGADDVDLWINNFTGNVYCGQASSNSFYRWEPITSNFTIYESAWDFDGHPAHSIIENNKKMANRSMLTYVPDSYADQEQYLNLTSPLVTIIKLDESHYNMTMVDNETEAFYYGILDENNDFKKWVKVGVSEGVKIDDSVTGADTTWSSEKIANDYSTKEYVAEQVANASHLKREIVTAIPEADAAQENTIYMFKVESVLGDDKYQEWQLINGEMVLIGDTSVDLSGYAKTYTTLDELGLTADATIDDVIGALKDGETAILTTSDFTNQLTMFPNFCTNDQYAILQVEKKNGNRAFIEWRQKDGNAYAIGGLDSSNKFTNWDNLVRFKKDGFGDDSIITIGDAVSSDGTIQTLESLGFSNDILTWKNGVYKVSHVAGLVNLPKDMNPDNSPAFRLEHHNLKKWQGNHNPSSATWGIRTSVLYADNGNIYTIHYQSGNTAGEYIINDGWKTIHTEKEDDNYIPDMYDRNANGDIPVVGFDRLANNMFLIQNQALITEGETYDEDYVGGWVYTSANDILTKEMFNKIKCIVAIPGVLRIGIMNEHLWDENPRYSSCLVKWLVSDFAAYTGLKEYDIEDTILEEGQYLFIECRAGESSWYYNSSTEDVKIGDVTYPASSCTTGLNAADKLDSTTNNVVFKSQSVTSTSARTYFGNGQYNVGSKYRTNFLDRHCTSTARTAPTPQDQSLYQGGLNVGLYRRTKYSDTRFCKCVENSMNVSWVGDDSVTKIYAAIGQEEIVGKSVYAFKLDVNTPGNLTIYHLKGKSLDTLEIIDKYTHYVRAKGLQTIHLPFDIKLESEDEYIGFGGLHFKSTSNNIVRHGCKWHYMAGDQTTGSCGWMNTIGKTGFYSIGVSMTSYPETFTSFETNGSYLNIELICRGEKRSPLEDKYISFTGDSITTFANFVTTQAGYPEGNTAGDNAYYYPASGKVINNVDATWWGILARDNRMQILRNDAWSGSRVSSATGSTDTKCLCGTERRYYLRNTYEPATATTYPFGIPEIVVNMIGTNDLSGNVELGTEMFKGVMGTEDEYKTILSAYSLMCRRFAGEYNKNGAKIVHFIIPRGSDWGYANSNGVTIADLSLAFERIAKAWGQYFIPLSYFTGFNPAQYKRNTCPTASVHRNFRSTEFSSADGLHPNVVGMEILADGVDRFLKEIM